MMAIEDTGAQSRSRKIFWIFGWAAIGAWGGLGALLQLLRLLRGPRHVT